MFSRISLKSALKCQSLYRLSQQCINTQAVAMQKATSVTNPDLVIKSGYVTKNVPSNTEYDAIPVVIDGQDIVVNQNLITKQWPNVPELVDLPTQTQVANQEDALDAALGERDESLEDELHVWFGHDMPTINDDLKPERDNVNFPRVYRLDQHPDTRMLFIPESWFKFFYDKTGVTGPYIFLGTFGTFLISKEYLILADDAVNGLSLGIIVFIGMKKFGKKLSDSLNAAQLKTDQGWVDWQNGMIKFLEEYIAKNKESQLNSVDQSVLFNAKRENIQLQREAEYRRRLMTVFNEAKRKLDFQVAIDDAKYQFAQTHMVNWIIDNVNKSITPELEKSVLAQCVVDLKTLSANRRNVI